MIDLEAVIGLEVHAQLSTRAKLFCSCPTSFGAEPNTQVCPICLGHPGPLPVVNRRAVELAVRFGLAVGSSVQEVSRFARKNYFYPDLPKNYQITQYEQPLCVGGSLEIGTEENPRSIPLERIHLEEDAGKSRHPERSGETVSRIDLNRCGVPLIEVVTRPEIASPGEAHLFLSRLRRLIVWLGVCDGNMEEGSLRCDANISLRRKGRRRVGTRIELKNLNSMRFVEKALTHEITRQRRLLEEGKEVVQETRLWDERQGRTRAMRGKEEAQDYRYFPEPDLPPLVVDGTWIEEIRSTLPELPGTRYERFVRQLGLAGAEAELLTSSRKLADYLEGVVACGAEPKPAAHWIGTELLRLLKEKGLEADASPVEAGSLASLLGEVANGRLSGRQAKQVLEEAFRTGTAPARIIEQRGLAQVSDPAVLEAWVEEVLGEHPGEVAGYLGGREALVHFFAGQVMRRSRGRANPRLLGGILRRCLEQRRDP